MAYLNGRPFSVERRIFGDFRVSFLSSLSFDKKRKGLAKGEILIGKLPIKLGNLTSRSIPIKQKKSARRRFFYLALKAKS